MTSKPIKKLGVVSTTYAYKYKGQVYCHSSFGRIVDSLANHCQKVLLCIPLSDDVPSESRDYQIRAENIKFIPKPFYTSSIGALKHAWGIGKAYAQVCRNADALFVRGMVPYVSLLYTNAWRRRCRLCHWIVGNPIALLRSHRRYNYFVDTFSTLYAWQHQMMAKLGRWLVNGTFMCNGDELANIYRSPQTLTVVSSALNEDEFFEREDTCQADKIRILFIGFIRPEKGVEYLIEAVSELRKKRPWELILVGSGDQFSIYGKKLDSIIARKGIGERVRRIGYVPYGTKMFSYLRDADIFVLPSLSEGTPRVLVEARANSLPVVATNVGGIPTSVTDGRDGLLVPPKDPQALSRAIERIIDNGELRRSLIKNGLHSAHKMTIGRFVDLVVNVMEDKT